MVIRLYYVYIMTNTYNKVLYTGVTNDLERRCYEHKHKIVKGFTQKYNVDKLVYFEKFDFIDLAISREKQIKGYSRAKKNCTYKFDFIINLGKIFPDDTTDKQQKNKIYSHRCTVCCLLPVFRFVKPVSYTLS